MIRAVLAHLAPDHSVTLCSTPHNVRTPQFHWRELGLTKRSVDPTAEPETNNATLRPYTLLGRALHWQRRALLEELALAHRGSPSQ